MARPRFNGRGFTNPIDSLGLNAESRHRANPQMSRAFMSNEANFTQQYEAETKVFGAGLSPTTVVDDVVVDGIVKNLDEALLPGFREGLQEGLKGGLKGADMDAAIRGQVVDGVVDGIQKNIDDVLATAAKNGDELGSVTPKIMDNLTKSLDDMVANGQITKQARNGILEAFGKNLDEVTGAAKVLPDAAKGADAAVDAGKNTIKNSKGLPKWATQSVAVTTAAGVTIWLAYQFGNSFGENAKAWAEDFTGANCGQKVADRGLTEGTDEYKEEVEECQEKAAKRMLIATGGGILILAGLVYVIVKK